MSASSSGADSSRLPPVAAALAVAHAGLIWWLSSSSLEGVGVEPTVPVRHAGPWAGGRDPILEKGLELAEKAKRPVKRGPI